MTDVTLRCDGCHSPDGGWVRCSELCTQELTIVTKAALSRMISVEPLTYISCLALKSPSSRVTVSRDEPIIWAISSCVSISLTLTPLSVSLPPLAHHSSISFASFSDAECDNPSDRTCSN